MKSSIDKVLMTTRKLDYGNISNRKHIKEQNRKLDFKNTINQKFPWKHLVACATNTIMN